MLNENQRLADIISFWTRSSASLDNLHGAMKPFGDRSGLGYGSNDSNNAETSCTPQLDRTKLQTMNFVRSSTGQPGEAQYDESTIAAKPPIWQGRYCGLGYTAPEKPRESWFKKRVEQMRGQPKSGGKKPGQFSKAFMKDRQYIPRYNKITWQKYFSSD
ncbi:hypothetical protein F511_15528 [Dorcoceras hygrometricum]|uniref:Uncharacterized protein n=1 Tax=Dorcoceras hygrometricum TaxID=472368 RepID=A0A2Z7AM47_9LAMI|nr:hypothetical protein F511_15528 [Dorcoceras hygrometricum]